MVHLRKAYFNILEISLHACVHVCVFRLFNSLICCFRALGNRIHTSNLKRDHLIERIINCRQVYSLSEGIEENSNNPLAWRDSTWWRKTISDTDLEFTGESDPSGGRIVHWIAPEQNWSWPAGRGCWGGTDFRDFRRGPGKTCQRAVQLDLLNTHRQQLPLRNRMGGCSPVKWSLSGTVPPVAHSIDKA